MHRALIWYIQYISNIYIYIYIQYIQKFLIAFSCHKSQLTHELQSEGLAVTAEKTWTNRIFSDALWTSSQQLALHQVVEDVDLFWFVKSVDIFPGLDDTNQSHQPTEAQHGLNAKNFHRVLKRDLGGWHVLNSEHAVRVNSCKHGSFDATSLPLLRAGGKTSWMPHHVKRADPEWRKPFGQNMCQCANVPKISTNHITNHKASEQIPQNCPVCAKDTRMMISVIPVAARNTSK